jgi:hypothetical protein
MRKYLHYLRIAFSATCLIACVLLIALWVRSYWTEESLNHFNFPEGRIHRIVSTYGTLRLHYATNTLLVAPGRISQWRATSQWHDNRKLTAEKTEIIRKSNSQQFRWTNRRPSSLTVKAPYWLVTLLIAASGVAPWIRWRFSLRALLIATTLVAMVLGLIVAVLRWPAG